jgi:hypothetical protein
MGEGPGRIPAGFLGCVDDADDALLLVDQRDPRREQVLGVDQRCGVATFQEVLSLVGDGEPVDEGSKSTLMIPR